MLSTILTCIALIAGFGILASQWTAVLERTHEIAVLQTLGCRRQNIGQIFLLEGLFLGTIAALLGIGAGLILLRTLSQIHLPLEGRFFGLEFLPVHIDPLQYLFLGISALVFVWGASIFPAWKATRIHPVRSLNNSDIEN